MCYVNRVKELTRDTARQALKRAVVNSTSVTDSPHSRPTSPSCRQSASYSLDSKVLSTVPHNDMTGQLRDILVHCSSRDFTPSDTVQRRVYDDQITASISNDGLSTTRGAWFLALDDSRPPRTDQGYRRRASTLDDIDELFDETVIHSEHQQARPSVPQPIIAWASDVECDDKDDEVAAEKQNPGSDTAGSRVAAAINIQTQLTSVDCTDTGKHQPTRSPYSDPAVSLDRHRATIKDRCTPTAGAVQSDFVLSSATRPVTAQYPREAVCKTRAEGDNEAVVSSTVCDRPGDVTMPADVPNDCCQIQSSGKVLSKLQVNNVLDVRPVGGIDGECSAPNSNLACYRIEQVVPDKSSGSKMTHRTSTNKTTDSGSLNKVTNAGLSSRNTATTSQRGQRTNDRSHAVYEMATADKNCQALQSHVQARCQSDCKQVRAETGTTVTRSHVVERDVKCSDDNKSDISSSPDTVKLLAELINKISELATRQDQLERISPKYRRSTADKISQTDDRRREAGDESAIPQITSTGLVKPSNQRQLLGNNDKVCQDERSLKQNKKQRCLSEHSRESQAAEQKISSQLNNDVSEAKRTIHSTPTNKDAIRPTKLTQSSSAGQQPDHIAAAAAEQQPPVQLLEESPSSAVTDNIVHIVRGSSALDDLTVDELVRHYRESRSPQRYQGPTVPQDDRQHSAQSHDDRGRSQDTTNYSSQQRRDQDATQDGRQVSPRSRDDGQTPQHATNVSAQRHCDKRSTDDHPRRSSPPRRQSNTPQNVARMQYVLRHSSLLRFYRATQRC